MRFNHNHVGPSTCPGDNDQNNEPLVSVLTPVLNANKYIRQCIESVLEQTYTNIEHVFADGGSTDGTLETLAAYQENYPERIRFLSSPDKGVGSALKKAYKICKGDILGWIDSDDKYNSDAVETGVKFFQLNPDAHFVYGRCNIINANSEVVGCFVIKDFDKDEWLNIWHYMVFCATFFRREVIEKVGFVNDLGNDLDFYLRVNKHFRMHRIEKTLTNWRLHQDSISLKRTTREHRIRKNRAKEDFFLVLKHHGSIFSPRALTYYAVLESSASPRIRHFFNFFSPVARKIDRHLKISLAVVNRKGNNYAQPLLKNIFQEFLKPLKNLLAGVKSYENLLYNSANMGFFYTKAGQRINRIPAEAVISQVRMYMDKVGNPAGTGACVVRAVSDDTIIGTVGTVDVSILPDSSAPHPDWVLFENTVGIRIPDKGDYRIVFEWDNSGGDDSNYPRVRYNTANTIKGVFTQFGSDGKWADHCNSDASIKMIVKKREHKENNVPLDY